ncbi:hypothetical protein ACFLYF_00195 [Chloroflexota bacterium]
MIILGFRIGWRLSGKRRRGKVPPKLERIARAALLETALKEPVMLAAILNKYGRIKPYHDDTETEVILQNLRIKIYRKAAETVLKSRRQELEGRIDRIIDRVTGSGDRIRYQPEEGLYPGTVSSGENGAPDANRRRQTKTAGPKNTPILSALLHDLELLAALCELARDRGQMKDGGDAGTMYAVEDNGQMVEMDEKEYRSYIRRRQGQQTNEDRGISPGYDPVAQVTRHR